MYKENIHITSFIFLQGTNDKPAFDPWDSHIVCVSGEMEGEQNLKAVLISIVVPTHRHGDTYMYIKQVGKKRKRKKKENSKTH